ncbi:GntR family transcriptional regulator [Curtobacterium pusillum]|uniref:GntR family transcriptional regulator n=1 Tax=Curtobacterium pusillum TaxID=69373 RepID=A0ABX2M509_9MICO|nr:GntR family transcriptional regulator [Curtobacterium pusillum]NUU13202.1 GntR family transcriptional regulator [Curtobacterium pusillum]GLK31798.1 GntR family transcriptional regulator [Curtobacterium pusillum]
MPVSSKRRLVADALRDAIATGRYRTGDRLPGEHDLAERFAVSRGTVRAALADLADEEYIATHGGVGSVVTFDGAALDPRGGWARSIAASGTEVTTRVLGIAHLDDPRLQAEVDAATATFVTVDRLRTVVGGRPVSLERSVLPRVGRIAAAVTEGLVDDSLTATIAESGLVPASAEQWIDVIPLGADDARLLERAAGTPFLRSRRLSRTGDGRFVERVDSLLDPDRFRLHMRFGTAR